MQRSYEHCYDSMVNRMQELVTDNNWLTRLDLGEIACVTARLYDFKEGSTYQAKLIADCLCLYFDVTLPVIMPVPTIATDIELFLNFLRKTNLIEAFTEKQENQQVLAGVIIYLAYLAETGRNTLDNNCMKDFLEQWTGQRHSNDTLSSEKSMVDILYGPGVWDIYLDQSDLVSSSVRQLHAMKLRVQCNNKTTLAQQTSLGLVLPRDAI